MAANKVGAKPSLFKKPAWASTSTKNTDNEAPIFGQAHLYQEILQEERIRRERHATKQKERAEKEKQKEQERETKRRRLSKEAEDSDYGTDSDARSGRAASVSSQQGHQSDSSADEVETKSSKDTPRKGRAKVVNRTDSAHSTHSPRTRSRAAQSNTQTNAIVLDDEDTPSTWSDRAVDDSVNVVRSNRAKPKPKPKQPDPESESEEEDDYLRELKARAREEAKTKRPGIGTGDAPDSPTVQDSNQVLSPIGIDPISPAKRAGSRDIRGFSTPVGDDEAEVKIWIRTTIPGAKDVIVNRKIGQPLDKVKEFWIKRNELEPALADKVFFTWNGTRLYNSTTMRGIIERLKKTRPMKDGSDPSNGRILLEAVTEEIFAYRQQQREKAQAEAEGTGVSDEGPTYSYQNGDGMATGEDDGTPVPQPQKLGIVIKLKAQGVEEMNLRVRPTTTMHKILTGFCSFRKIDPNKQKWLSYDGDRLEEDATVEDVGFEHEDTVEVYLR